MVVSGYTWRWLAFGLVACYLFVISTSYQGDDVGRRNGKGFYEEIPKGVLPLLHGNGTGEEEEKEEEEKVNEEKVMEKKVSEDDGVGDESINVGNGEQYDSEEKGNKTASDGEITDEYEEKRLEKIREAAIVATIPKAEIDKSNSVRDFYDDPHSTYICKKTKLANGSKPAFLVVGVHKGGTTALFGYLAKHGRIRPSICKEIDFFGNDNYKKGMDFYLKHFYNVDEWNGQVVVGEGTPNYIRRPNVPYRVKKNLPNTKIIMALRNPVHRFVSHWVGLWSRKLTKLPCDSFFNASLDLENKCMTRRGNWNESYYLQFMASKDHDAQAKLQLSETRNNLRRICMKTLHEEALSRSIYHYQIERWLTYFPENQIKILQSEHLFNNVHDALQQTVKFIGIRPYNEEELSQLRNTTVGSHHLTDPLSLSCPLRKIGEYFEDDNHRLRNLLRERFPDVLNNWEPGWDGLSPTLDSTTILLQRG